MQSKERRSHVLFAMVVIICLFGFQMNQYTAIAHTATNYYGVTYAMVTATSGIVDAFCLLSGLSLTFIFRHIGFKSSLMITAFAVSLSASAKCLGLRKDDFWINLLSNAILGSVEMFIYTLPAVFAEAHFAGKATASVKGVCLMALSLGYTFAFLQPFLLLHSPDVYTALMVSTLTSTGLAATTFFFIAFVIRDFDLSKNFPLMQQKNYATFWKEVKEVLTDRIVVTILLTNIATQGVFAAVTSCLNQLLDDFSLDTIGKAGICYNGGGMLGSVVCSMILDKTRNFKMCAFVFYAQHVLSVVAIAIAIQQRAVWLVYLSCTYFAFISMGVGAITVDIMLELTYPLREELTIGLMIYASMLPLVAFRQCTSDSIIYAGPVWSLLVLASLLFLCLPLLASFKWELKRTGANKAMAPLIATS